MLHRPVFLLLFALFFSQGCATSVPTQPVNAGLQKSRPTALETGTARTGLPAPAASAASRVYRDPVTGEFTAPPPETEAPSAPVSNREAVSIETMPTMQELAIEGGGTLIHLQGRFRSYMSATKDSEGKITVHCNDKPNAELHNDKASEK